MPEGIEDLIARCAQPCRMEKIPNADNKNVILDVCHNIDGFKAVFVQLKAQYPQVKDVKIVMGISKSKKLSSIVEQIEKEELIKDLYVVSRPHMRLSRVEEAHKIIQTYGCEKLKDIIMDENNNQIISEVDT